MNVIEGDIKLDLKDNDNKILLHDIIIEIEFKYDGEFFVFDFGNCQLKGACIFDFGFHKVFHFFGYYVNTRTAAFIDFKIPIEVESFEQGVAFIAYYLRGHHFSIIPGWFTNGLTWQLHLPWVRDQLDYENTAKASIDREWFKLIVNKIIKLAESSHDNDVTIFSFDGEVLKIICNNGKLFCASTGSAWNSPVTVKTRLLKHLPKRIRKSESFYIYAWKNNLYLATCAFEVCSS